MTHLQPRQIDRKLSPLRARLSPLAVPRRGWIATIRETLGMTTHQLGQRLHLSQQRVSMLERSEVDHATTLKSLEKAAESLGCHLFYCLVPNEPLERMVWNQALQKASQRMAHISQTMELEGQGLDAQELKLQTIARAHAWLRTKKNLWAQD